jgi:hypothetical protein
MIPAGDESRPPDDGKPRFDSGASGCLARGTRTIRRAPRGRAAAFRSAALYSRIRARGPAAGPSTPDRGDPAMTTLLAAACLAIGWLAASRDRARRLISPRI